MSAAPTAVFCPPGVCDFLGGGSILKGASDKVASSVMSAFSGWVVTGAAWLVTHLITLVVAGTSPHLIAPWFEHRYATMVELAALLVGPLLAAATIGAVIRQDSARLLRIWAVGLPVGVLCASTAIALTQLAVGIVDELCVLITPPGKPYAAILGLTKALSEHGAPPFVQFIIASVIVLAAIALWMELVLRAAVLYIAVFFLPLGLAAFIWPATAPITKRFVELIIAVVGSKFVIVATLTLGSQAIGGDHTVDGVVTGTAILLLAAFAPFSVLRLVPVVEAAAIAHLEGTSRRPARAAMAAGGRAVSAGRGVAGGVAGLLADSDGGLDTEGVGAVDIGRHAGDWVLPAGTADDATAGSGPDSAGGAGAVLGDASGGVGPSGSPGGGPGDVGGSRSRSGSGGGPGGGGPGGGGPGGGSGGVAPGGSGPQTPTGADDGSAGTFVAAPAGGRGAPPAPPWASWPAQVPGDQGDGHPGDVDSGPPSAPVVADLPAVVPGVVGPDLDGWSDDE